MNNTLTNILFVVLISSLVALTGLSQASASPTIIITDPTNGASIATLHAITVKGTASDPAGIQKVEVSVDGGITFLPAIGTNSWSFTRILPSGSITLVAKATSNSGTFGVTSIPTGPNYNDAHFTYDIAVNPLTQTIYATDYESGAVLIIDGTTDTVTNTLSVDGYARGVAVNPLTSTVYVSSSYSSIIFPFGPLPSTQSGSVSVIYTPFGVIDKISVGKDPEGVLVNPSTNTIYVANSGSNTVSVIDGLRDYVIKTIPVETKPIAMAIDELTHKIYVTNSGSNTVSVIDVDPKHTATYNTVIDRIVGQVNPIAIAVNPLTHKIYVADSPGVYHIPSASSQYSVSIIDGTTDIVIGKIQIIHPAGIAVDSSTNTIYVTSWDCSQILYPDDSCKVSIIDGATDTVTNTVLVEQAPFGIVADTSTHKIYVANSHWEDIGVARPTPIPISISVIHGTKDVASTSVTFTVVGDSHDTTCLLSPRSCQNLNLQKPDLCIVDNHLICKVNFDVFRDVIPCYGPIDGPSCPLPHITKQTLLEIKHQFPPLKQLQAGIPFKDIVAAKGQVLIVNPNWAYPLSVTPETAKTLIGNDPNWKSYP